MRKTIIPPGQGIESPVRNAPVSLLRKVQSLCGGTELDGLSSLRRDVSPGGEKGMMNSKNHVKIVSLLICLILASGCVVDTHDTYSQKTIASKHFNKYPLPFGNPDLVKSGAWCEYDYFISSTNGDVALVTKDVYGNVFEGHTYILKWGHIRYIGGHTEDYGYTELIKEI